MKWCKLRHGLRSTHAIADITAGQDALISYLERLTPCDALLRRLDTELEDEAPLSVSKGAVIKPGVNEELDDLRRLKHDAKSAIGCYLRAGDEANRNLIA